LVVVEQEVETQEMALREVTLYLLLLLLVVVDLVEQEVQTQETMGGLAVAAPRLAPQEVMVILHL
jgi:hypothetical protein